MHCLSRRDNVDKLPDLACSSRKGKRFGDGNALLRRSILQKFEEKRLNSKKQMDSPPKRVLTL